MLNKAKALNNYKLHSLDGEIGKVKEFYFDDHNWNVQYLIADTGSWLTGRQVLISPYALEAVSKEEEYISLNLTKSQIENSPPLETDEPVSQQFQEKFYGYYEWPMYGAGLETLGQYAAYPLITSDQGGAREYTQADKVWDPHLRSTDNVSGYNIQGLDGEVGHVKDFIIDDETWKIRYLVVDTRNWWPGKKILLSTQWIEKISWDESKVFINLPCENMKQSPEYTEDSIVDRDYEITLHQHYNRKGYWTDKTEDKKGSFAYPAKKVY